MFRMITKSIYKCTNTLLTRTTFMHSRKQWKSIISNKLYYYQDKKFELNFYFSSIFLDFRSKLTSWAVSGPCNF